MVRKRKKQEITKIQKSLKILKSKLEKYKCKKILKNLIKNNKIFKFNQNTTTCRSKKKETKRVKMIKRNLD